MRILTAPVNEKTHPVADSFVFAAADPLKPVELDHIIALCKRHAPVEHAEKIYPSTL